MQPYKIAIAGTTHHTTQCAKVLLEHPSFEIVWVLTPAPKPVGRKKIITPSPLQVFAEDNALPVIHLHKKITTQVKAAIARFGDIDFLLVVDFGYIIPRSLLVLPKIAPLNIHPSNLPQWRGSSPAQFSLLYGEKKSAITLMQMNHLLDQGPIIAQIPFMIQDDWNAADYYTHSFNLMCDQLPKLITAYAQSGHSTAQPLKSTTKIAHKIDKKDTFIPWKYLAAAQKGQSSPLLEDISLLYRDAAPNHTRFANLVVAATKAFSPWPKVWTLVQTTKGEKRMQIHTASVSADGALQLETVQLEGQSPANFNQIKNSLA